MFSHGIKACRLTCLGHIELCDLKKKVGDLLLTGGLCFVRTNTTNISVYRKLPVPYFILIYLLFHFIGTGI